MKLLSTPDISAELKTLTVANILTPHNTIEAKHFTDLTTESIDISHSILNEVRIEKSLLFQVDLTGATVADIAIDSCDISAGNASNSSWLRANLAKNRMAGINFSEATLRDVVFEGCKLDLANFRFAQLMRVHFVDCTLIDADFTNCKLTDVHFSGCTMTKVDFNQVTIKNVDFRGSELSDIGGWRHLKGANIDSSQLITVAHELAAELGLKVSY